MTPLDLLDFWQKCIITRKACLQNFSFLAHLLSKGLFTWTWDSELLLRGGSSPKSDGFLGQTWRGVWPGFIKPEKILIVSKRREKFFQSARGSGGMCSPWKFWKFNPWNWLKSHFQAFRRTISVTVFTTFLSTYLQKSTNCKQSPIYYGYIFRFFQANYASQRFWK